jgi:transposase-like protein
MAQKRRFTAEKKIEILREYLENDVPISELCEKYELSPTMIYNWKKQLFEGALQTFTPSHRGNSSAERKIKELTQTLQDRDSLISEIVTENVRLKKSLNGKS